MNTKRSFTIALLVLMAFTLVAGADAEVKLLPLTTAKLLGSWRGGNTNGLNCRLVFDNDKAMILTFVADKNISTVCAWYNIDPREGIVTLGINGAATALPNGKLELKLTRQFDHITVLREATLERMPEPKQRKVEN